MRGCHGLAHCLAMMAVALLLFGAAASARTNPEEIYPSGNSEGTDYGAYAARYEAAARVTQTVELFSSAEGILVREGERVSVRISVAADCFGYPVFTYAMEGDNILDNITALQLDGQFPYDECEALSLDSVWTMPAEFTRDRYGNEVVTMPVKDRTVTSCRMIGKAALYEKGMGLFLTAGEHELALTSAEGSFVLYGVSLAAGIEVPASVTGATDLALGSIEIQAERVDRRNNPNIRPSAQYNTALTPYSSDRKVINLIDDSSYKSAGDRLSYDFTVEKAGYYALALRMRQSEMMNFPVYRSFYIDGELPSEDFDTAEFPYSVDFTNAAVETERGELALVYLSAGPHTLDVVTTVDPVRPAIELLTEVSDEMAALSLALTKVTGGNTDFFRDFSLADFDFHIGQDLNRWIEALEATYDFLAELADGKTGALSDLNVAIELLRALAAEPNDLPKHLTKFARGDSSARAFIVKMIGNLNLSYMGLDSIHFFTAEAQLPRGKSAWERLTCALARFAASFSQNEYVAGADVDEAHLQVWVNRPRQYLEIMQRMADAEFTPRTGIAVDFSIMPDANKLILANASGSAPDVALGVSSGLVYDLAVRGALANLREFEDFAQVASWFPEGLLIPGACDDGLYALPETFNFTVLFYRKDILASIGLSVPDSYEDVLQMLPALNRYGLNFNNFVANAIGYKGFSITTPFIFQAGGLLYEDGNIKTQLGQAAAVEGLKILTDSFIIYDMDYEIVSFYQAFRDGTLPVGTSNYGTYNQLMNAAPELEGRWGIALYPGLTDEDGVVQRWTSGAEQSDFIFSSSGMRKEAWTFLSWWMGEEAQTEFAFALQSTMGNEYLWNSANIAAFLNSPWPSEDKQVLAEQMRWIYEAPRVPGSYMVEREISNAVNAIVLDGENLRSALDEAIKRIDREVERKLEEFGRLKDGELQQPFVAITIDTIRGWLQ